MSHINAIETGDQYSQERQLQRPNVQTLSFSLSFCCLCVDVPPYNVETSTFHFSFLSQHNMCMVEHLSGSAVFLFVFSQRLNRSKPLTIVINALDLMSVSVSCAPEFVGLPMAGRDFVFLCSGHWWWNPQIKRRESSHCPAFTFPNKFSLSFPAGHSKLYSSGNGRTYKGMAGQCSLFSVFQRPSFHLIFPSPPTISSFIYYFCDDVGGGKLKWKTGRCALAPHFCGWTRPM